MKVGIQYFESFKVYGFVENTYMARSSLDGIEHEDKSLLLLTAHVSIQRENSEVFQVR